MMKLAEFCQMPTRVAGHYPDTRRDNILCGYIKKSVEREIWNKLNKNDPACFVSRNDILPE